MKYSSIAYFHMDMNKIARKIATFVEFNTLTYQLNFGKANWIVAIYINRVNLIYLSKLEKIGHERLKLKKTFGKYCWPSIKAAVSITFSLM